MEHVHDFQEINSNLHAFGDGVGYSMKGVVSKIAFVNPHAALYIDVTNKDGGGGRQQLGRGDQ